MTRHEPALRETCGANPFRSATRLLVNRNICLPAERLRFDEFPVRYLAKMGVSNDGTQRFASQTALPLEERFEVIKEIGDGSFGSVALARVRGAGANVARRGTMVMASSR